jgi:hypothetical protein
VLCNRCGLRRLRAHAIHSQVLLSFASPPVLCVTRDKRGYDLRLGCCYLCSTSKPFHAQYSSATLRDLCLLTIGRHQIDLYSMYSTAHNPGDPPAEDPVASRRHCNHAALASKLHRRRLPRLLRLRVRMRARDIPPMPIPESMQ